MSPALHSLVSVLQGRFFENSSTNRQHVDAFWLDKTRMDVLLDIQIAVFVVQASVLDVQNVVLDIQNVVLDIQNVVLDIQNVVLDI